MRRWTSAGARRRAASDHGPGGRAPHDRVVDHDQPLAGDGVAQRVELAAHALVPLALVGGDEGAADVAVLDQALPVGDAAAAGVALGRRDARVGHAHDHVGRRPAPGRPAARPCAGGRRAPPCRRGGCRAGPGRRTRRGTAWGRCRSAGNGRQRRWPVGVDDEQLARLELPDEAGADDVEGRRLRGQHPAAASSRPRQRGRKPLGSRTPISRSWSMRTREKAPSQRRQHGGRGRRPGRRRGAPSGGGPAARRSGRCRCVTTPGSIPASAASASVLVRLPLWPRAKPLRRRVER